MQYVIIGNSAGAIGCIEGIRQLDTENPITLISAEKESTYSRPLISYWLAGKVTEEAMRYRDPDFYEKNKVTPLLGVKASSLDPDSKTVYLEDGRPVRYDRLLCATGSVPFIPPMEGLDTVQKKHTFLSFSDAKALAADLTPDSRVLILGAGLIGMKCAEGLAGRVKDLTVVDLAPQILPSILNPTAASMVQRHVEKKGISFILGDSVKTFAGGSAVLQSGRTVGFDVLALCVGVRPNTALLLQAGAETGRGVITDENLRTSLPDVYAAGDCTESVDITTGGRRVLALLPNAYQQGESAGIRMAGGCRPYNKAIAMNAIGFFGLHMITAGSYVGTGEVLTSSADDAADAYQYKELFTENGLLKGYILLGDVSRAGIYTALIRDQVPLASIDYDLIKQQPQLMAFTKRQRKRMLGEEH